ncbi:hypothetical protein HDU76_004563, partial [Blyttiomyces sp. JEL0837]
MYGGQQQRQGGGSLDIPGGQIPLQRSQSQNRPPPQQMQMQMQQQQQPQLQQQQRGDIGPPGGIPARTFVSKPGVPQRSLTDHRPPPQQRAYRGPPQVDRNNGPASAGPGASPGLPSPRQDRAPMTPTTPMSPMSPGIHNLNSPRDINSPRERQPPPGFYQQQQQQFPPRRNGPMMMEQQGSQSGQQQQHRQGPPRERGNFAPEWEGQGQGRQQQLPDQGMSYPNDPVPRYDQPSYPIRGPSEDRERPMPTEREPRSDDRGMRRNPEYDGYNNAGPAMMERQDRERSRSRDRNHQPPPAPQQPQRKPGPPYHQGPGASRPMQPVAGQQAKRPPPPDMMKRNMPNYNNGGPPPQRQQRLGPGQQPMSPSSPRFENYPQHPQRQHQRPPPPRGPAPPHKVVTPKAMEEIFATPVEEDDGNEEFEDEEVIINQNAPPAYNNGFNASGHNMGGVNGISGSGEMLSPTSYGSGPGLSKKDKTFRFSTMSTSSQSTVSFRPKGRIVGPGGQVRNPQAVAAARRSRIQDHAVPTKTPASANEKRFAGPGDDFDETGTDNGSWLDEDDVVRKDDEMVEPPRPRDDVVQRQPSQRSPEGDRHARPRNSNEARNVDRRVVDVDPGRDLDEARNVVLEHSNSMGPGGNQRNSNEGRHQSPYNSNERNPNSQRNSNEGRHLNPNSFGNNANMNRRPSNDAHARGHVNGNRRPSNDAQPWNTNNNNNNANNGNNFNQPPTSPAKYEAGEIDSGSAPRKKASVRVAPPSQENQLSPQPTHGHTRQPSSATSPNLPESPASIASTILSPNHAAHFRKPSAGGNAAADKLDALMQMFGGDDEDG